MKIIEQIVCWRYPCDEKIFKFDVTNDLEVNFWYPPVKHKKDFEGSPCDCGKNCKPEKIKITVEKV